MSREPASIVAGVCCLGVGARALHIVHLNTSRGWGGGELQIMHLMRGLRRAGLRSTLLARSASELYRRASADPEIGVEPFDFHVRHNPFSRARLRGRLRQMGATVLHLHDGRAVALGVPAAQGLAHVAVVIHRRVSKPIRRNPLSQRRYRSKRIDAYIVVSETACQCLDEIAIPRERMTVIPGAVDVDQLERYDERMRMRSELGAGEGPMIGTVGALEPMKDIGTFIQAAGILARRDARATFVVVGDGRERGALEAQARAMGLEQRISFTGVVPRAYRYIGAMDAFVFPSLREGSPGVVKEAMVLGVPVIATRASGTEEAIPEGTGVLVPAGDAAAFARAVGQVLDEPDETRQMVREARTWVTRRYSMSEMVDRTIGLYDEVAAGRSSVPATS